MQKAKVPKCRSDNCDGTIKPNVTLFGELLHPSVADENNEFSLSVKNDLSKCDLLIVMGTSLSVS